MSLNTYKDLEDNYHSMEQHCVIVPTSQNWRKYPQSVFSYIWNPLRTPFASLHPWEELPNSSRTHGILVLPKGNSTFLTETLCKTTIQTIFLLFLLNIHIRHIKEHFVRLFSPLFFCGTNHRTNLRAGVYFIFIILLSTAFSTTFREGEWGKQHQLTRKYQKLITTLLNVNP